MPVSLSSHAAPLLFGAKKGQSSTTSTKRPHETENERIFDTIAVAQPSKKLHAEPAAEKVDVMLRDQLQDELDYAMIQAEASIPVDLIAALPPVSRTSLRPDDSSAIPWTERQLLKDHKTHSVGKTYNGLEALMDLGVDLHPDHQFDDLRAKYKNPKTAERKRNQAISAARGNAVLELHAHKRNPFVISETSQQYLKSVCLLDAQGDISRPVITDLNRLLEVQDLQISLKPPKSPNLFKTPKAPKK